ncbi:MAG TPA: NYN domain-containing protein [Nocardioidaceae bacterium]|nr:NYN domain-containing protein [Nocardioidaceae bacterium]
MPEIMESDKLAVLIDADNATPSQCDALLSEIAKYGVASVKRAYGDWTTDHLKSWKSMVVSHAIQPMQQFANTSGKNSTDSAMIIDAMDLLYTNRFDGFCIVTSDSDFTRLASRIRESGLKVYGFGERKTPDSLTKACDKFIYMDVLRAPADTAQPTTTASTRPTGQELKADRKLVSLVRAAIEAASDEDGWAHLSTVGSHIAKQAPEFDSRNWRYAKLVDLVSAIDLFEVQRKQGAPIKLRSKKQPAMNAPAKKAAKKSSSAKKD